MSWLPAMAGEAVMRSPSWLVARSWNAGPAWTTKGAQCLLPPLTPPLAAAKKPWGGNRNRQLQITGPTIGFRPVASSFDKASCAVFDARRNGDFDRFFLRDESRAMTRLARIRHDAASAATTCTRLLDGDWKHALLHANASTTKAQITSFRR